MQLKLTKKQAIILGTVLIFLLVFWVYFYQIKYIAVNSLEGTGIVDEVFGAKLVTNGRIDFWSSHFEFQSIDSTAGDVEISEVWDGNTLIVVQNRLCEPTIFDNMDMFQFKVNEYDDKGTPKIITYSGQMIDINCNGAIYEF